MSSVHLLRRLGLKEALALVIGSVIGTGVFLKTAVMAQQAGSPTYVLLAWLVAGVLSLMGALSYAELGCHYPEAGGEYIYLREGYGPLPGFLYGWMRFWIGTPGGIAAYAVGAATFSSVFLPQINPTTVALVWIVSFTFLNCFSVAFGGGVQTLVTILKVLMVLGLTLMIFFRVPAAEGITHMQTTVGFQGWNGFGAAVLAALWAFDGWNNLPMAAGEIRNPQRVIPRSLGLGMALVFLIYAVANLAYFIALPYDEILTANSTAHPDALPVATKAAAQIFGPSAVGLISIAFVISALGAMNGSILTGARVPYAMAQDGLFFPQLAKLSQWTHTPILSVIVQGAWACVLAVSGTFDQLTDYVVFASWIF